MDRISIGSSYLKGNLDDVTLKRLVAASAKTSVDAEPDQPYLQGSCWHLRTDLGRNTPADGLLERLDAEVEASIEAIPPRSTRTKGHSRTLSPGRRVRGEPGWIARYPGSHSPTQIWWPCHGWIARFRASHGDAGPAVRARGGRRLDRWVPGKPRCCWSRRPRPRRRCRLGRPGVEPLEGHGT